MYLLKKTVSLARLESSLVMLECAETVENHGNWWSEQAPRVETAVSHSECVMRAERLWEAARTGLGRSPPAGVCRLTDSSALVYHTTAATGREC